VVDRVVRVVDRVAAAAAVKGVGAGAVSRAARRVDRVVQVVVRVAAAVAAVKGGVVRAARAGVGAAAKRAVVVAASGSNEFSVNKFSVNMD
jgi:hypothetical protein